MLRCNLTFIPVFILLAILIGCSGSAPAPIIPAAPVEAISEIRETDSQRALWGVWNIRYDLTDMSISIEPARNAQPHFNITNMIIPPACDDCLEISANSFDPVTRIIDVDVTLRNPHAITGYDVRGILYTNDYGHLLTNALGWTKLFDVPGGQSLNPFKGFYTGPDPAAFGPGEERTENYLVYIPMPPAYNQITFAVDASWPTKCKEPYGISFFSHDPLYDHIGATAQAQVSVFDWQDDVDGVTLVATEITGEAFSSFTHASGPIWQIDIVNNEEAPAGDYEARIIATSTGSGETALYQFVTIIIDEWDGPIVTGIDPDTAEPEDTLVSVDVTGSNFAGPGAQVKLIPESGLVISATAVGVIDTNTITCDIQIPLGAYVGMYDVEVTNGDTKAGLGLDLFEVTSQGPVVTGIDPDTAEPEDMLVSVDVTGSNFAGPGALVKLIPESGPVIAATNVSVVDANNITCDIDIPVDAYVGIYDVEVTNGDSKYGLGLDLFEVTSPGPIVTGIDPDTAEPDDTLVSVDVTGSNFAGPGVLVKLIPESGPVITATAVGVIDSNNISCDIQIPQDAYVGMYDVEVTNGDSKAGAGIDLFEITCPVPVVTDIDPDEVFRGDDLEKVTITGDNFWGTTAIVKLTMSGEPDIVATGVSVDNYNTIYCNIDIPINAKAGMYSVVVTNGCDETGQATDILEVFPLGWVRTGFSTAGERGRDLAMDKDGNCHVVGNKIGYAAFYKVYDSTGDIVFEAEWGDVANPADAYGIAFDASGNVYIAGCFDGDVDLDPDAINVDMHASNGYYDAFLVSLDSSGAFRWGLTWGGSDDDYAYDVALQSNRVCVCGFYRYTVDFDPDPGAVDELTPVGGVDAYLSRFDLLGGFSDAVSWGGAGYDLARNVATYNDNIYVAGEFGGTVDFDPRFAYEEIRTVVGEQDAYVSKFNSSGTFQWVQDWGGTKTEFSMSVAAGSTGVYIGGYFKGSVIFDPKSTDPGDEIDSNGDNDMYLTHFLHNGQYEWTDTFGGTTSDYMRGVSIDPTNGDILLSGMFTLTVDFDPGPGTHEETVVDDADAFLCRLDSDGNFVGVSTWGGGGPDCAMFAAADATGEFMFVTGYFSGTVDFDPGPGSWPETSLGGWDFYLMRLTSAGTW